MSANVPPLSIQLYDPAALAATVRIEITTSDVDKSPFAVLPWLRDRGDKSIALSAQKTDGVSLGPINDVLVLSA